MYKLIIVLGHLGFRYKDVEINNVDSVLPFT